MPIKQLPQFKATPDKMLEIPQPAIGGLNLKDLEFEQEVNQSPYMKNVMYRNGAFSKRYGQAVHSSYDDPIYASTYFDGAIFVHSGTKIYRYITGSSATSVGTGIPEEEGVFIVFQQKLYYLCYSKTTHSGGIYGYASNVFSMVEGYIPELVINCSPDGTEGDTIDDINLISLKFKLIYNGVENEAEYLVGPYDANNIIDWTITPEIEIDDTPTTAFSVNVGEKKIVFNSAPPEGDMNVTMTFTMKVYSTLSAKEETLSCKYYDTYGGQYNSRVFLAGNGTSRYYWCSSYDITYWPSLNYARLGNTEDDITGFGRQYNILIAFKPRETYQIVSYTDNISSDIGAFDTEYFRNNLINSIIGCDAPHSIQIINNLLTWFNSKIGVCTLVSTNTADERNIRVLSRNVERMNNFGIRGILDVDEDPLDVVSIDFDKKYFLAFPTSGTAYVWDYEISPYFYSSANGETPPARLTWFYFDNMYVKQFLLADKSLLYFRNDEKLIQLNMAFDDFGGPIECFYMTPFLQFGAVEMLKNVKNMYVQCRGDTSSLINIRYYTDDSSEPETDPEPIQVDGGENVLWSNFNWDNFRWYMNTWGNVFRRKCNLKKIEMCAMYFSNNEAGKDMSLAHIGLQYQLVKYVR